MLATLPWDSYLICSHVWSYPPEAVLGPSLFAIPLEEVFFFVIQTYNTSLLYLLISKPTFHSLYLRSGAAADLLLPQKWQGATCMVVANALGWYLVGVRGAGFYFGLILVWATPFALILW